MNAEKKSIILVCTAVFAALVLMFSIYAVTVHMSSKTQDAYGEELSVEDPDIQDQNTEYEDSEDMEDTEGIFRLTDEKPYGIKLVEDESINILIVGEDRENNLYDTIMVVSVSKKDNTVKIIQIARDTYIEYSSGVKKFLKSRGLLNEPGIFKINYSHNIGVMMSYGGKFDPFTSMNFLTGVIEEKLGIKIDDFIRVDIQSFVKAVDLMGGVDIDVPYDMNYDDPVQDLSIHLEKGMQHLDGKQAEGFVRYRQGYDRDGVFHSYGDVGRKKNQIAFIKAFIAQHGTLGNIDKIPELLGVLNLRHSIGVGDMLFNYLGICRNIITDSYKIESVILSGEPKIINGSSYIILKSEEN
jgi:LCP family protein required for cell wall assembly